MVGNRKAETPDHSLLKHIVASIFEREGYPAHIECECPDGSIIDVFIEKLGLAIEIQSKKQPKIEKQKVEKYMKFALVNDVMFISVRKFPVCCITNTKTYKSLKFKLIGE